MRLTRTWRVPARIALAAMLLLVLGVQAVSAQAEDAMIRVVHASPDAPAVDIWVNGEVAIQALAFGEATDYVNLPAGDYDIAVTPAGGTAEDAVIEATLTLAAGAAYTVAAIGEVAEITAAVLMDDLSAPADGMSHVRVFHASPDAPAVDVAVSGGPVLIENLAFGDDSGYLPVDAATYDLEVRPAGTEDVAIDIPGLTLESGTIYTVFAIGMAGDGSLTVLPLVDASYQDATGGGDVPAMPETGAGGAAASSQGSTIAVMLIAALALAVGVFALSNRIRGTSN